MRKWVKTVNDKEVRHLLISDTWNKDYFDPNLFDVYEKIAKEDEQLSGTNNYTVAIADKGSELNQELKKIRLQTLWWLFNNRLDFLALELIKEFNLKYKNFEQVDKSLKRILNNEKLKEIKGTADKKKQTYEDMLAKLQIGFAAKKINISIDHNITVAGYRAYERNLKEL